MNWGPVLFEPRPGPILHIASGLLLVALAVFVMFVRPRRRANFAFAGFSGGWGLATVLGWIVRTDPGVLVAAPSSLLFLFTKSFHLLLLILAAICLVLVAIWFPRGLSDRERPFARNAAIASGMFTAVAAGIIVTAGDWSYRGESLVGFPVFTRYVLAATILATVAMFGASLFALILLALRARFAQTESREAERRQYVLMSVALLLKVGVEEGISVGLEDLLALGIGTVTLLNLAALGAVSALWLATTRIGAAPGARAARNMALLTLALPLVGWGLMVFFDRIVQVGAPPGIGGMARTVAVFVLAYAIVRHQILGLDVKVRWTISKGTIAAIFIAVFFIASEAAQEFLGETTGSMYLGIVAAGALVFAIAPIQRAAERLAAAAIPETGAASQAARADSLDDRYVRAYRAAVAAAINDGQITSDEEHHLAEVAEHLRIGPLQALRIRRDVEREFPEVRRG